MKKTWILTVVLMFGLGGCATTAAEKAADHDAYLAFLANGTPYTPHHSFVHNALAAYADALAASADEPVTPSTSSSVRVR